MKNYFKIFGVSTIILLFSCGNEDMVKNTPTKGIIEASITTGSSNGTCVMRTQFKVKDENGFLKTISHIDTIPCLKDTTIVDDDDKRQTFQKQYEIYLNIE